MLRPPFLHSDAPAPAASEEQSPKTSSGPADARAKFDWKSAASLRAPEKIVSKAEREWDSTEWDDSVKPVSAEAQQVAQQLDRVAQKIRSGDLPVDGRASTPETAVVAALEALIKAK